MQKSHVVLSEADRKELTGVLHQSNVHSKVLKRVIALLELDKGKTLTNV